MLSFLRIENLAIIDTLSVDLGPGLNILTGETGAGKSILVDAVGLVLGERGSADQIRAGEERLSVEAVFEIGGRARLIDRLEAMGIDAGPEGLVLKRDVFAAGRSRAFVNGSPVTLSQLKEIGDLLADLHGQHQHQSLLRADAQADALDRFGEHAPLLEEVGAACRALSALHVERERLRGLERDRLRREEELRLTVSEIAAVSPKPGEDAELRREEALLRNAVEIRRLAEGTAALLNEDDASALARLGAARERLSRLSAIDERAAEGRRLVDEAVAAIREALREVDPYLGTEDAGDGRLEGLASRLAAIEKIARRYGPTVEDALERLASARRELAELGGAADRLASFDGEIDAASKAYSAAASRLTRGRGESAKALERALVRELKAVAMEGCRFAVGFEPRGAPSEEGAESIEFLIAPNPGEALRPLARIASGGELSRLMLALRTVSLSKADARALVFDEVDTGLGGGAADAVAQRLKGLARGQQILCVTHLPQVAALADTHIRIEKVTERGRTKVVARTLGSDERVEELARMIGSPEAPTARRHAAALIEGRKTP
ncbi:MAG: DNA repair protein RecN [Acidobacteria bacterium]|nr:DNA repair protein RecN [Acidobacteriota bacterium]